MVIEKIYYYIFNIVTFHIISKNEHQLYAQLNNKNTNLYILLHNLQPTTTFYIFYTLVMVHACMPTALFFGKIITLISLIHH